MHRQFEAEHYIYHASRRILRVDGVSKKRVALIFGGRSSEHDVSCVSAVTVAEALDKDKYEIVLVGITKEGHWLLTDSIDSIKHGSWIESDKKAVLSPDTDRTLIINRKGRYSELKIDVAIPILHGLYGEDGSIQGLFDMADIPYVGCGTLSSAVTMDKFFTKVIVDSAGIDQALYVPVRRYELQDMAKVVERVEKFHAYPVFIKPSNAGSSMGISKAHNRTELIRGLKGAAKHDSKILVEEYIKGREIECAVFGYGGTAFAAGLGEIIAAGEFYDFDAKYLNSDSRTIVDPTLPLGKKAEVMKAAVEVYRACDCFGMARVDFFLEEDTGRVVFNEINAIPGHTSISMYPRIMKHAGFELSDYFDKMIEMAYHRND